MNLRLITWNCARGRSVEKVKRITAEGADLTVVIECSRAATAAGQLWAGTDPAAGVLAVAGDGLTLTPCVTCAPAPPVCLPFRLCGRGCDLNVLAVWAKPLARAPRYVGMLNAALDAHRGFLRERECIVVGDFNSSTRFGPDHGRLVERLRNDFGLASVYHAVTGEAQGQETRPTFHMHRKHTRAESAYHIDYCFVPMAWDVARLAVTIGEDSAWLELSDHRPLQVVLGPA
jgi:hypothetical protein